MPSQRATWAANLAALAIVPLVVVLVMILSTVADAKPGNGNGGRVSGGIEKCHPRHGCIDGDTNGNPEPTPEPEPTADPTTEPDPAPEPDPTPDPTPYPTDETDPPPSTGTWSDASITNTAISGSIDNLVEGRLGSDATRTVLVYKPTWGRDMWVRLVDHVAGATADVKLPDDGHGSWQALRVTIAGDRLWTLSGVGPVTVRQFRIGGSAASPTLSQVDTKWYGSFDSRVGDLTTLDSGSVVAVWHQQGASGLHGHGVALHRSNGSVTVREVTGLGTMASKDVVAQHPGDGTIWILSNADSSGTIGRIRLAERTSSLDVLSVDHGFIGSQHDGFGPDPENPRLAVAADSSSGELVLAYQSATRQWSSSGIRSYPAVARLAAGGGVTFRHLPVWVERVTPLGLTVRSGELWLSHRPISSSGAFDRLEVAHLRDGTWSTTTLGSLADGYEAAPVDPRRPIVVYERSDAYVRWAAQS